MAIEITSPDKRRIRISHSDDCLFLSDEVFWNKTDEERETSNEGWNAFVESEVAISDEDMDVLKRVFKKVAENQKG